MTTKPLIQALRGERPACTPVWLMRQAGRYLPEYRAVREKAGSFLDLCYTPELAAEVTLQPIRRFGMDGAILFSDILVVPHALGRGVRFVEGEGPKLDPLGGGADVPTIDRQALHGHLAPVYETVARVRAMLPPEVALIGFAGAPWTVATYMIDGGTSRDHLASRCWAFAAPDDLARLIDVLVEATAEYLIAQIEAGAEAVQLFESWAGALSDAGMRRWSLAPCREIARRVRAAAPEVPIVVFPRGAGIALQSYASVPEVDALGIDQSVPAEWAAEVLQPRVAVQGNLDPVALLAGGGAMEAEIERIGTALGRGPHVFNLGHGVIPATPPEHVARLVEAVRARPVG